jgi:prolycopene isomerase
MRVRFPPSRPSRRQFMRAAALGLGGLALDWTALRAWAQQVAPKSAYPIVVIGAGIGGLSAGGLLAKNGFPVTVVERHDRPGGYVTAFRRGDFTFEVSPHYAVNLGPLLTELGVRDKVELVSPPYGAHLVGTNVDLTLPFNNPTGTLAVLAARFPGDAGGLTAMMAELAGYMQEYRTPVRDPATLATTHPIMSRLMTENGQQFLDGHVRDAQLRVVLGAIAYSYGRPPSEQAATNLALGLAVLLHTNLRHVVRQAPLSLAQALASAIEANGGKVLLDTEATRITTRGDAVVGVRTASGADLPARAVIANANAPTVFGKLLDPDKVPPAYAEKLRTYRLSNSTFLVSLGIDRPLADRGYAHSVLPTEGDWDAAFAAARRGEYEGQGFVVYTNSSMQPRYAPEGKGTISIFMMGSYDPWRKFEADYFAGRKEAYNREKQRVANLLVERTEKTLLPGLRSMIEVIDVATPLTNMRYTGNPGGAILGYDCTLENCGRTRLPNRTPVKGLYLASAWGDPGGGVNPVMRAGQDVLRSLMADWNF